METADRQQDEHDAEFESFLRQFQPRTPPALKANRPMMLVQSAVAVPSPAVAASTPVLIPRTGPVAQNARLRVGGAVRPPRRVFTVNPTYPEEAKAEGIEGVVVMQITIGEDGSVINVVVLRSVPMLDQAAIDAVLQWVYEPTLLNGMPVEVEMTVTVNFTLVG